MNTMMIFVMAYAAYHLAEDILNSAFEWLNLWNKEKRRERNRELRPHEVDKFYWSLLEGELSWLHFHEPTFSKKYDSMTFIGTDHSIRIDTNGRVYGCETSKEFSQITCIVSIAREITELWRKSTPMSKDMTSEYRILLRIGDVALAAQQSLFSGAEFSMWQFNGDDYKKLEELGGDYIFAKEVFALYLLLANISLMPEGEEETQKRNTVERLLNLAKERKGLIERV